MTAMPVITSVKFNDHPVRRTVLSSHGHCDVVLVHEAGFNLGKVPPSGPGQARPTGQHLNPAVRHRRSQSDSCRVRVAPAGRRRRGSPDPGGTRAATGSAAAAARRRRRRAGRRRQPTAIRVMNRRGWAAAAAWLH